MFTTDSNGIRTPRRALTAAAATAGLAAALLVPGAALADPPPGPPPLPASVGAPAHGLAHAARLHCRHVRSRAHAACRRGHRVRMPQRVRGAVTAHAASAPPAFSRTYWSTGVALCSGYGGNTITVYPPNPPAPADDDVTYEGYYFRSGLIMWDGTANKWLSVTGGWVMSAPFNRFAYDLGAFSTGSQNWTITGHNLYIYTWVQVQSHFGTFDQASWGTGGTWTPASAGYYVRNAPIAMGVSNGGCYFA